jgi:metallo-beta-lactamase class B
MILKNMTRTLVAALVSFIALFAQENAAWKRPFPAHHIAGNIYYVGTEDLACFLLASRDGHILVNTGLADSTPLIRANIAKLGYKLEDVKILLTMQAHFDHVAAMAEIQRLTGAKVYATEADSPVLEDGGRSDPFLGRKYWFAPVKVSRLLKDGDIIRLGSTELRVILTPGHTRGSVSYETTVEDGGRRRSFLFVNIGTVVMPLVGNKKYPGIAGDFASTFEKQRRLAPDIWVAAHASQYNMASKLKAGSFIDPGGYRAAIARSEAAFRERLEKEQRQRAAAHR